MTIAPARPMLAGPSIAYGFLASVLLWVLWFITHVPWVGLPDQVSLPLLLVTWFCLLTFAAVSSERGVQVAIGAGLISASVGLLLLGSKLTEPGADGGAASVKPSAPLLALGFLATGGVLGLVAGLVGRAFRPQGSMAPSTDPLRMFAKVCVLATAPLLFIGGLVTSTDSGMAVPDWPNTFGSNMFLYPLTGAAEDIFLEHSHRLFGTLVGLTTLILAVWTLLAEQRRWVRVWAVSIFVFVVVQGVLGGSRVIADSRVMAIFHGVSAQVIFAALVAFATFLSDDYRNASPLQGGKRTRIFATAALHSTLLQLVLGAVYRHLRSDHALWTHAGFAMIVLVAAVLAGFSAMGTPTTQGSPLTRSIRRCGIWILAIVAIQFTLGWIAFIAGGREQKADSILQALIRTAHQANGALLLGFVTAATVTAKRIFPKKPSGS
jgi:cytochrome c oxidase assembly protein subunit 15